MSDTKRVTGPITLDWSRLLGFDQVARQTDQRATPVAMVGSKIISPAGANACSKKSASLGAKVGSKPARAVSANPRIGAKVGAKDTVSACSRIGAKVGAKGNRRVFIAD